ncbi:MAG TPA: NAD(P)-binding domain-containing protein [Pyrinomonadaceae bacterium]
MRVGILGSGLMGGKLGTIFARAGHEVVFTYARSNEKLKKLAREAHGSARAGTPSEAAQEADALLLAVHWSRIEDVLNQTGDLSGKVVVTCSLPMNDDNTDLVVAHISSGAEELARMIPKARVVSAFNTVPSEVLFGVNQSKSKSRRLSLVYCGDDKGSKAVAAELIRDVGFDPMINARAVSATLKVMPRFHHELAERFAKFKLKLHPQKTFTSALRAFGLSLLPICALEDIVRFRRDY